MKPFFILACGGHRVQSPTVASHMFDGQLFQAALAYARDRACDEHIVMLTGFEGLLRLDTEIDPVNPRFLSNKAFADLVRFQLRTDFSDVAALDPQHIVFLGFDVFWSTLTWAWYEVNEHDPLFQMPLVGVTSNNQVEWLRRRTRQVTSC